jgi:hypothetical protein
MSVIVLADSLTDGWLTLAGVLLIPVVGLALFAAMVFVLFSRLLSF